MKVRLERGDEQLPDLLVDGHLLRVVSTHFSAALSSAGAGVCATSAADTTAQSATARMIHQGLSIREF